MKRLSTKHHESTVMRTDEWLTPPSIIRALGDFDLDPCSPITRPWDTAKKHYNVNDNGLTLKWEGRVWMNPPYGKEMQIWIKKLAAHDNGIALIFARTDTAVFHESVFNCADSIMFLKGRLSFYTVRGTLGGFNGGAASVLIAYGKNNTAALEQSGIPGKLVYLTKDVKQPPPATLF